MRVGLLLCDHLDEDAAAVAGDYTTLMPRMLEPHGVELEVFDLTEGRFPASVKDFPAWITSGSRRSAYTDEAFIPDLLDVSTELAAIERPHAGICFGHQVIARALGGTVERHASGWGVGAREFDIVSAPPWMTTEADDPPDAVTLLMSHRDQVTALPSDAEVIATADYCVNGAFRVGDHVFTVQGHPEFTPELSAFLMRKRQEDIGDDGVGAGLASLDQRLDSDRVARWIATFLRR